MSSGALHRANGTAPQISPLGYHTSPQHSLPQPVSQAGFTKGDQADGCEFSPVVSAQVTASMVALILQLARAMLWIKLTTLLDKRF